MAKLPKLTQLKGWLPIKEAAQYLSLLFDEQVAAADVLRLGLDGHLKLSVRFVNETLAIPAPPSGRREDLDNLDFDMDMPLEGVCDLPMVGAEKLSVERAYQRLTGGAARIVDRDPRFVEVRQSETPFWLLKVVDRGDGFGTLRTHVLAEGLPDDAALVVRRTALDELAEKVSGEEPPLDKRAEDALYTIIAAVCRVGNLDINSPKLAAAIEAETVRLENPIALRTVQNHLKSVRELFVKK